jgi:hypothetical protein
MENKYIVYDLETLQNCFTAVFEHVKTGKQKAFVIHASRNDLKEFMKCLRNIHRDGYWLVGFNCNAFDAQILEHIIKMYHQYKKWSAEDVARDIYKKAQFLISLNNLEGIEKFKHLIPEWNFNIPHIDIYKQKHYDGKGKRCSLKWLEFTMRFHNIETMPIHHSTFITEEDIPSILRYNANDVRATGRSFEINRFETDLRFKLSEEYNLNLINASEPRLARDIFGKFLSEEMGILYRDLKERRTYRNEVKGQDLIFSYVKFKDPVLLGAKDFYEKLEFNPYNFKLNNYGLEEVNKTFKFHNLSEVVIGLGGIHGCVNPGVYTSRPKWVIRDIDGTSYYPNLGIKNRLYPKHLSDTFCNTYENVFNLRQQIDKKNPVNYVFKIILNSAYGLSKEMNNYFHDPNYTFGITINGQLLLLMLAELLRDKIKSVVFYQLNTDGVTIGYDESEGPLVDWCMKKWEKHAKINLEDKYYDKMVIMDVNNYIAVDTKGGIKRKGLFGYSLNPEDKEMDYHKNPSMLVVPKALEAFFIHGTPIKDYINNCEDIFDFCLGVKIKKDFDLIRDFYDFDEQKLKKEEINQSVVRYYVSHEGSKLRKKYKKGTKKAGQKVELVSGWNTTYFNVYEKKQMKDYGIDYDYYIGKARKVVDAIVPHANQSSLF